MMEGVRRGHREEQEEQDKGLNGQGSSAARIHRFTTSTGEYYACVGVCGLWFLCVCGDEKEAMTILTSGLHEQHHTMHAFPCAFSLNHFPSRPSNTASPFIST